MYFALGIYLKYLQMITFHFKTKNKFESVDHVNPAKEEASSPRILTNPYESLRIPTRQGHVDGPGHNRGEYSPFLHDFCDFRRLPLIAEACAKLLRRRLAFVRDHGEATSAKVGCRQSPRTSERPLHWRRTVEAATRSPDHSSEPGR